MCINDISKYRTSLMGFAILWIMLLHFGGPTIFLKIGYLGVDIFLFLSAFGLCFSLKKSTVSKFYLKRVIRVIPIWWLLITIHLLTDIYIGRPHPENFYQFFCYYTGLGWFLYPARVFQYYCEWYIPTLLLFYFLSPFFYKRTIKELFLLSFVCLLLGTILSIIGIGGILDRTYMRLPVFIGGFILYKYYESGIDVYKKYGNKLYILFGIGLSVMLVSYYLQLGRIIYCGFFVTLPTSLLLLLRLFKKIRILGFLTWVGAFTLELYLIHIYDKMEMLVAYVSPVDNKYANTIFSAIVCVLCAFVFHKMISPLVNTLNSKIHV